jgi:hypothetical protein
MLNASPAPFGFSLDGINPAFVLIKIGNVLPTLRPVYALEVKSPFLNFSNARFVLNNLKFYYIEIIHTNIKSFFLSPVILLLNETVRPLLMSSLLSTDLNLNNFD